MENSDNSKLTYKVNGCALRVYNKLGPGFQEVIYQRALAIELDKAHINYVREQNQYIYYEGIELGTRRADFVVEGKVLVELKATTELLKVHLAQAKNYLTAYNLSIGLLINFGSDSLIFKKIYPKNQKYNSKKSPH